MWEEVHPRHISIPTQKQGFSPHTHTQTASPSGFSRHKAHLRLGLFGIQIASHRVCVLNVLLASGDMNYSKIKKKGMQNGTGGIRRRNNFSSSPTPRTNILKRCAAYKRGQRKKQDEAASAAASCHLLDLATCAGVCAVLFRPPLAPHFSSLSRCVAYKCPESESESGSGSGLVTFAVTFVLLSLSRHSKLYPLTGRCSAAATAAAAFLRAKVKVKVNPSAKIQYFMH